MKISSFLAVFGSHLRNGFLLILLIGRKDIVAKSAEGCFCSNTKNFSVRLIPVITNSSFNDQRYRKLCGRTHPDFNTLGHFIQASFWHFEH